MPSAETVALHGVASGAAAPRPLRTGSEFWLDRLKPWLSDPSITDICCNGPGAIWIERGGAWELAHVPGLTREWINTLANAIGNHTGQWASKQYPLLSATIPSGERIQFVLQPAAREPAFAIRRPSASVWSLGEIDARGSFSRIGEAISDKSGEVVRELLTLKNAGRYVDFMRRAVQTHQNIVLSGGMGSGKTTVAKALIGAIDPRERVISIEDAFELGAALDLFIPNNLQLRFSTGAQGLDAVTVLDLFIALKRLNPNRILASEMRSGEEVAMFFQMLNSGHPGAMATGHADSALEMFNLLGHLLLESRAGRNMTHEAAVALAKRRIDVVIQCCKDSRGERFISEVWYEPGHQ